MKKIIFIFLMVSCIIINAFGFSHIHEGQITPRDTQKFSIGDHVKWQHDDAWYTGTLNAVIDKDNYLVKFDNDGTLTKVAYSDLNKIGTFNVNEHVKWQFEGGWYSGTINHIIDNTNYIVKFDNDGDLTKLTAGDLFKMDEFNIGDHVTWKYGEEWYTGSINSITDKGNCMVKFDNDGTLTKVALAQLLKVQK